MGPFFENNYRLVLVSFGKLFHAEIICHDTKTKKTLHDIGKWSI